MTVEIQAGGTVSFIISGLHNVVVYDNGTQPGDIDISLIIPPPPPPPNLPPIIDDPHRRIYRGLDPRALLPTLNRVEVVHFANPGTYLVICAVLPHFLDDMFGFVRVLSNGHGTGKASRRHGESKGRA
jgi:plastocyanin